MLHKCFLHTSKNCVNYYSPILIPKLINIPSSHSCSSGATEPPFQLRRRKPHVLPGTAQCLYHSMPGFAKGWCKLTKKSGTPTTSPTAPLGSLWILPSHAEARSLVRLHTGCVNATIWNLLFLNLKI